MPVIPKILVPTDFSPCAQAAVDYAADLAVTYRAPLVLMHAYANPAMAIPDGFVLMTNGVLLSGPFQFGRGLG